MLVEEVEILPTLPVWISEGIGSTVPGGASIRILALVTPWRAS